MSTSFSRAPHIQGPDRHKHPSEAPNAALLVDFDNVTMGMRSDLSRELKSLLNSDIIKGKVTVQRAYADWRRYPQYIVPLSEASIDLIFAPAYGSSKKNATDIRMAIDGMELVFTRPEIGTYILLTGDSDFSSLVIKLKEYGKYVIGVGIQESSSDILVQNCDEYYSYTSISGLRKTTDADPSSSDPWVLVGKAMERMSSRKDVMRSDRLKQVMLELDPAFDEKSLGYSKFSRFLTEAAQKGLLQLRKLENGQYELKSGGGSSAAASRPSSGKAREREAVTRSDGPRASSRRTSSAPSPRTPSPAPEPSTPPSGRDGLQPAYDLLLQALADIMEDQDGDSVRDSDVKRRMLALDSSFDEAEMGFGKFSLFLRQAHDHEVITLRKGEEGNYHVSPGAGGVEATEGPAATASGPRSQAAAGDAAPSDAPAASRASTAAPSAGASTPAASKDAAPRRGEPEARRLRPRTAASRRRGGEEPPPILEGQVVGSSAGSPKKGKSTAPAGGSAGGPEAAPDAGAAPGEAIDPEALRLPTDRTSMIKYLSNSYGGVGEKTAETLVEALGGDLFKVLQTRPSRVTELLPPARAEKVLAGWEADFGRRRERYLKEKGSQEKAAKAPGSGSRPSGRAAAGSPPTRETSTSARETSRSGRGTFRSDREASRSGRGTSRPDAGPGRSDRGGARPPSGVPGPGAGTPGGEPGTDRPAPPEAAPTETGSAPPDRRRQLDPAPASSSREESEPSLGGPGWGQDRPGQAPGEAPGEPVRDVQGSPKKSAEPGRKAEEGKKKEEEASSPFGSFASLFRRRSRDPRGESGSD